MSQAEKQKLTNILSEAFIASCKKLSTLLKQDVAVSFGSLDEFEELKKAENTLKEVVVIKTSFEKGEFYNIIPATCGAPMAELMMTGEVEGSAEIGDLKEKAIGEAFTQVLEDFSAQVSTALSQTLTFQIASTTYCKDFKEVEKIIPETAAITCLNYDFAIADIAKGILQQVISADVFNLMSNDLPSEDTDLNIGEDFLNLEQPTEAPTDAVTVQPVQFPSFDGQTSMQMDGNKNFDLLLDIKLKLTVELGRAELPIKKVLELTRGSIIELDKIAGEPVELYANGKLVAKGEVVVIEDNFGLRITTIVSPDDRIKNL